MLASREQRQAVEQRDDEEQRVEAEDEREVLQGSADHGAEQVCPERHGGRSDTLEADREEQVRQEDGKEGHRDAGEEAGCGCEVEQRLLGMSQAAASAPSSAAYRSSGRRMVIRRAASIAARTLRSTPAKTAAFTAQVVPKSSANWTTFLVSNRRKAAPMKKRSTYGRIVRSGPATARTMTTDASRTRASIHR